MRTRHLWIPGLTRPLAVSPWLLPTAVLLVIVGVTWSGSPARAQTCVEDNAGVVAGCTAKEVTTSFSVVGDPINGDGCDFVGDTATVVLRATLRGNTKRYDPGFFVALDGGNARTGACQRGYFTPLAACGVAANATSGQGPYANLECSGNSNDPNDTCGDLEAQTSTYYDMQVVITCRDSNGDGTVDAAAIISWNQSDGDTCNLANLPLPGTSSKCDERLAASIANFPVPKRTIRLDPRCRPGDLVRSARRRHRR